MKVVVQIAKLNSSIELLRRNVLHSTAHPAIAQDICFATVQPLFRLLTWSPK